MVSFNYRTKGRIGLFFAGLLLLGVLSAPRANAEGSKVDDAMGEATTITIDSDTMLADNRENFIIFSGDVIARERFLLCSDELRVDYNEDNEIKEIKATGSVRVIKDASVATGDEAIYNKDDGTMILTGNPSVTKCGDRITGERIIFNIEDETAMVESGGNGRVRAVITPEKDCTEDQGLEEDICRRTR